MKKSIYIVIILAVIGIAGLSFLPSYLSTSANPQTVEITVPEGASLKHVSNTLHEKGVIKNRMWFEYKAKEMEVDRKIKPGSYSIPSNSSLQDIFQLLEKGNVEEHVVLTIPEGFTIYQIGQRVEDLGLGTRDAFIEASEKYYRDNYDFDNRELFFSLEGYLYPETYYFTKKQSLDDIVARLAGAMDDVFTEEYIKRMEDLKLSKHEILTIASLIEREAKHDGERATISGVIYNRLDIDMILQIDATVIYGVGRGRDHNPTIYQSNLDELAPFNSYKLPGLPPGPIASPGKESIQAALYPEDHEYLYYVLSENEDGHVFSKTHAEHVINRSKYVNRKK